MEHFRRQPYFDFKAFVDVKRLFSHQKQNTKKQTAITKYINEQKKQVAQYNCNGNNNYKWKYTYNYKKELGKLLLVQGREYTHKSTKIIDSMNNKSEPLEAMLTPTRTRPNSAE